MPDNPDSPIVSINRDRKGRGLWGWIRTLVLWPSFFVALASLYGLVFVLGPVDTRLYRAALTQPLVIFRKTGEQVQFISCICGTTLRHEEIPDTVANALVATEDRRFLTHYGVDFLSFGKALVTGGERGGSTLEMQLAKNSLNGSESSIYRKFAELFFATRISLTYDKRDVLRLYLSRVSFGRLNGVAIFGLRDAAWAYFDKPPDQLNTAEAAILVAMINAPTLFNPIRHPEATATRANLVLRRLQREGMLPADAQTDIAATLPTRAHRLPRRDRFLEDQVMREVGGIAATLPDGLHFALTTVDPIAQDQARRVVIDESKSYLARGVARGGLLSVDPEGRVLAMVGGLNYRASNWNLAFQAERQAASTAKIATYIAALESGWGPEAIVFDDPAALVSAFKPRNVDGQYKDRLMLKDCLKESRNVCTMWLAEQVGLEKVSQVAQRIGLTATQMPGSAIVLGAAETTMARNAAAYLSIANGGRLYTPYVLRGVLGDSGKVLYRAKQGSGTNVMSLVIANRMKDLLGEVTGPGGTGTAAQFEGGRVFGKTGTSQENRDAWFVGFTDLGITTAVWVGPAEGKLMRNVSGGRLPAEIFAHFNVNLVERFQGYIRSLPPDADSFWRDVNEP